MNKTIHFDSTVQDAKLALETLLREANLQLEDSNIFQVVWTHETLGQLTFQSDIANQRTFNEPQAKLKVYGYQSDPKNPSFCRHGDDSFTLNGVEYCNLRIEATFPYNSPEGSEHNVSVKFERKNTWDSKTGKYLSSYPSDSARAKVHAMVDRFTIEAYAHLLPLFERYKYRLDVLQTKEKISALINGLENL